MILVLFSFVIYEEYVYIGYAMDKILSPAGICGQIDIPASKSQTIRALLLALFSKGTCILHNPLISQDTQACFDLCRQFGATLTFDDNTLIIDSSSVRPSGHKRIDCKNSGTTMYFAAAMCCAFEIEVEFTGDASLCSRPVLPLVKSLQNLGAHIEPVNARTCPFTIKGPLTGGQTAIRCTTSQYLSALLLACPIAKGNSVIEVPLLYERPYVKMTEKWLKEQGIVFDRTDNMSRFTIQGNQQYQSFETVINGDFSSASFFFCAAAITGGTITVNGLKPDDPQGDKGILKVLSTMGCGVQWNDNSVTVSGPARLKAGDFDLNAMPDTLPALAITACFASGPVKLYNVPQARSKETDRIAALVNNINLLGGQAKELDDGLVVYPVERFTGVRVPGFGDHRIVMAMAVASLKCENNLTIEDSQAVDITFPGFFDLFSQVSVH